MAEVFGIAAGAIGVVSLSIQLAESLQKVKSFYAAAKNAPTQIEELIEEIEVMQDILSDLESGSQSANMASSANMQRCMKVAQRATKSFVAFSGQLQTRIKKSKFRGGVKFALSRDDIKEMLDQLERTKSSLNLAYSLYQQATAEDRHAALVSAVSLSQGVAVGTTQNTVTLERSLSQVSRRSVCSGTRLFHLSTPEWISNTIWQFEMRRSIVGLSFMLRTYGVIPMDAPILHACMRGDAVEMQRLFDERLASPFDRSPWNGSLWETASIFSQGDSLRLLSQYDAASDLSCGSEMGLLFAFHCNGNTDPSKDPGLGVGRRFREELIWLRDLYGGNVEYAFDDESWSLSNEQAMRLMLCPPEDADSIWFWQFLEMSLRGLDIVLSEEFIKDMLSRYIPEHHGEKTPLQLAAVATGRNLPELDLSQELLYDKSRCLEVIIAAMIASGAGLHEGDEYNTPLLLFLTTIVEFKLWDSGFHAKPRELRRGLIVWLKIMQNAGVDLVAYGAEESRRFLAYRSLDCPKPPLLYWQHPYAWTSHEVLHFTFSYGPTPEDWTVRQDHMVEQYVGDFWQMPGLLDEHLRAVPGAWIDEV